MSNVMSMKQVQNRPSRNGFDLSFKRNFTAKAGELLPVMCKEVIPGDKVTINLKSFTRTQPINTAAFARIREYYDFFFVPFNQLWNRSNTVLSQMNYNQLRATGLTDGAGVYNGELPYTTTQAICDYITNLSNETSNNLNYFGYSRAHGACKLLEYLNYGSFYTLLEEELDGTSQLSYNVDVNILGLLAYQKVYADFYRDEQWEKPNPSTFNVDYMSGQSSMEVDYVTPYNDFVADYNFFDLRYCNWPKDLYHGLLPNPQYGDTAVVPIGDISGLTLSTETSRVVSSSGSVTNVSTQEIGQNTVVANRYVPVGDTDTVAFSTVNALTSASLSGDASGSTGLSILALRQYEFLQKWREIAQSADQDYKSQVKSIWNVDVSHHLADKVMYLGGINSSLDINEVVNTNITGDYAADIAGKGVGISNGNIEFNSDGQFGYIMCIYHCMPLVDYTCSYTDPQFMRVNAEDFANPVFDRVGMQSVNTAAILGGVHDFVGRPSADPDVPFNLGYAPRYVDYKTSIDTSVGAFKDSLSAWVVSYNRSDIVSSLNYAVNGVVDENIPQPSNSSLSTNYTYFKVNPNLLDPIFAVQVDDTVDTDQFLCSTFFDIKAVRNLDVDGLPY